MDTPYSSNDIQFCSINSKAATEPLYGTAPRTDVWLLLEYPYSVGRKALPESNLSTEIKTYLTKLQGSISKSRLVLVRNEQSSETTGVRFYIADARESLPRLYEVQLTQLDDLLSIDALAVLAGNPGTNLTIVEEPMYIVCTNGKRDACCARWGLPTYQALAKDRDRRARQSSHVGGHRFAANMICLPHGIYFGRLSPDSVTTVADAYARGYIAIENYRGRGIYPPPAQAGEYFLRSETKDFALNSYNLLSTEEIQLEHWQVAFRSTIDGSMHKLNIEASLSKEMIFESCSSPDERKPVNVYNLARYASGN